MKIEFNNLYIHFVLTTLNRYPFIQIHNRTRIEKYITGIINNSDCRLYAIYANPEHIHLLVSKSPKLSEDYLVEKISESSEKFINEHKLVPGRFSWQSTAAAFSVSKSDISKVCKYILNQPSHHKKVTFEEEYNSFMEYYQQNISKVK